MNEQAQSKWTGPDEINGVLHVGKGYRQATFSERFRADREQWYPGDSENGENGIWADTRPGSFHPARVYRVPVERKDEPGVHGDSDGEADPPPFESQHRPIMSAEHAIGILGWHMRADSDFAWTWHCNIAMAAADAGAPVKEANERAADFMRNAFGVDVRGCDQWKAEQSQAVPPPVGEFEDGGREGGPDCQTGKCDAIDPEYLTAADFLPDDAVNHPSHYNAGPIECIDAIRAALTREEFRGFCKGNAIKYVWRERGKGGDEDLDKGGWYLDRARNEGQEGAE